jgi:hypothetical protein
VNSVSALILIKVLGLIAAGVAFFWWQFRDLARERERTAARKKRSPPTDS